MNVTRLVKSTGAFAALALVSACASGSAVAPSATSPQATYVGKTLFLNGVPTTAARINPLPTFATLVPEKKKKSNDYEYVINYYGTYASMFNYPASNKMVGKIVGAGGQGCTNVLYGYGKKIIWNAGRTNDVVTEYQVPSNKVLKTLSLPYTYTSSCAMNAEGDIAIGVLLGNSYSAGGQVVIFKGASGSGKVYNTPLSREYFDGYDPKGDLFANGYGSSYDYALVELPKGSSKFVSISLPNSPQFPGSVQWDGTYVSVFDQLTDETYQYTISGTTATLKNTVRISGASDCAQTWIVKGLLYCGDAGNNSGEVFKYPAGGSPVATFSGDFDTPLGVTAAKK